MKLPVIIYQMNVVFGDPEANMNKIKTLLQDYNPQSGTLLVLPELFLTGYSKDGIEKVTVSESYPEFEELLQLSRTYGIIIYGSVPRRSGAAVYNESVLIEKGQIIQSYKKSHLFGPMGEKDLFSPGKNVSTVNLTSLKGVTIGLSICYDLRFPELYFNQRKHGINLILICAEWPISRINHWNILLQARAIENQLSVIACNRVGDDPNYHYGGHSGIYDSYGKLQQGLEHDEEGVIQFELDLDNLSSFRQRFDTQIDRWIV